jgi:hypothetical protein
MPLAAATRADTAYSATESGPYCQPSVQSPPSRMPPSSRASFISLPQRSSATTRHSRSPASPASPPSAIAMKVAAIR